MKKNRRLSINKENKSEAEEDIENNLAYNIISVVIILLFLFTLVISWLCLT